MRFPIFNGASFPAVSEWASRLALELERLVNGDLPVTGEVTLTPSAGTTTVSTPAMTMAKKVVLFPLTANAAAEVGNGTMYVSSRDKGSFTITHANSATTGRDFQWVIT